MDRSEYNGDSLMLTARTPACPAQNLDWLADWYLDGFHSTLAMYK